jgi:23S rRNA (guanosine2251-2'-O)-methyltransferase
VLELRNPHSVLAALKYRPQDVREIRVPAGRPQGAWADVADAARNENISVVTQQLDAGSRRGKKEQGKSERVGTATAVVCDHPGVSDPEKLLRVGGAGEESDEASSGLWLALDCLQDPHNVGAIFRTAAFFGVRGILLTKDRSAPMTPTVYDVAAGGVESVPFCQVPNLARSMETAKQAGLWLLGTSEHASSSYADVQRDRAWLLVIGNEEKGLRRLTLDNCDVVCGIPSQGDVTSLNASVAAAIIIARLSPE